MATAEAPRLRKRVRGELKSVRNAVRRLTGALAELERIESVDRFGDYVVEPDEELDADLEEEVVSMLHMAREDHPNQRLEVIFIAQIPENP